MSSPTRRRRAMRWSPLVALYGIDVFEREGHLVFMQTGRSARPAVVVENLVLDGDGVIERRREPDHALPARAELNYRDPLNDHQSAAASADHVGVKGNGTRYVSFPGVLEAGEAEELARDWLKRVWNGRESLRFSVPASDRSFNVGDIIRVDPNDADYVVSEADDGLVRQLQAKRIARHAVTASTPKLPDRSAPVGLVEGPPHAVFLDLPMLGGSGEPRDQLRVAARARPWRSQVLLASPEASGFELRRVLDQRATMGFLTEPLASGHVEGRMDHASRILVKLLDGELASVSRAQLLNGANAAAVRSKEGPWEVLQFAQAEEVEQDLWALSGLLRGQAGTGDAMIGGAPVGADFVLLDDAVVPAGLRQEEAGLQLNWKIGPAGQDLSSSHFLTRAVSGGMRALAPLAPVHLRARRMTDGLRLSWVRRGRVEADSWFGEDIPLGETQESYQLEIASFEGAIKRRVTSRKPEFHYETGMISTDFAKGASGFSLTVRQVGAFGPGVAASARIPLP